MSIAYRDDLVTMQHISTISILHHIKQKYTNTAKRYDTKRFRYGID